MRRLSPRLCLVFSAGFLLLAACIDQRALLEKFRPDEDDAFVRRFFDLVKNGQDTEATAMLAESIQDSAANELWKMRVALRQAEPVTWETLSGNRTFFQPFGGKATARADLVYQLRFPNGWALATATVITSEGSRRISTAYVQPLPNSLEVINRFTFAGKSVAHYLVFAACVFVPLLIVVTIVVCIRSRVRRRWLWIIFIAFGIGQFSFNWTTKQWTVTPLALSILGTAYVRMGLYAPWVLKFSVPLGAILFFCLRRSLERPEQPRPEIPVTQAGSEPPRYDY